MSTYAEVEADWHGRAASRGVSPLSDVRVCPRSVLGQDCPGWADGEEYDPAACGLCTHGGVIDHAAMWTTAEGERVFTTEPYSLDPLDLADFCVRVSSLGLSVTVSGDAWWHPDAIRITVTPLGVSV